MTAKILVGDCRDILDTLPDASVQTVVTSPPYYGLRDYGEDDQIGLEETPEQYIAEMVDVFRRVRRVLRDDGTVWLNLGDSYASSGGPEPSQTKWQVAGASDGQNGGKSRNPGNLKPKDLIGIPWRVALALQADGWWLRSDIIWHKPNPMPESVTDRPTKAHEYVFLLTKSARYYYDADAVAEATEQPERIGKIERTFSTSNANSTFRNDVGRHVIRTATRNRRSVWSIATKPYSGAHFAVMPPDLVEPCIKAGTSEHGACPECGAPWERVTERTPMVVKPGPSRDARSQDGQLRTQVNGTMIKPPTVTAVGWQPTCGCYRTKNNRKRQRQDLLQDAIKIAYVMLEKVEELSEIDREWALRVIECDDISWKSRIAHNVTAPTVPCVVLDPFAGAGTVGLVADRLGRDAILIELNMDYAKMAQRRIVNDAPMFARVEMIDLTKGDKTS